MKCKKWDEIKFCNKKNWEIFLKVTVFEFLWFCINFQFYNVEY